MIYTHPAAGRAGRPFLAGYGTGALALQDGLETVQAVYSPSYKKAKSNGRTPGPERGRMDGRGTRRGDSGAKQKGIEAVVRRP
jgi:hypothetical protein